MEREAGEVAVAHEDVVVSGADVAEAVEEASRRGEKLANCRFKEEICALCYFEYGKCWITGFEQKSHEWLGRTLAFVDITRSREQHYVCRSLVHSSDKRTFIELFVL